MQMKAIPRFVLLPLLCAAASLDSDAFCSFLTALNNEKCGATNCSDVCTSQTKFGSCYVNCQEDRIISLFPSKTRFRFTCPTDTFCRSLTSLSLVDLPTEIGRLTALRSLDLFKNKLTSFPTEMALLTQMRSLFGGHVTEGICVTLCKGP